MALLSWVGGVALAATVAAAAVRGNWLPAGRAAFGYSAIAVAITLGVVVWLRRPDSRTGILLTAFPISGLLADLEVVFPTSAAAVTVGFAAIWLPGPVFAHLVLSYPTGRLTARVDRAFVAAGYGFALAYALPFLLFHSPRAPHDPDIWECGTCAEPLTHVAWRDVSGIKDVLDGLLFAFVLVFLVLLIRKLVRATRLGRRVVLPLAVAAVFSAVQLGVQIALFGEPVNSWAHSGWFVVVSSAMLAVPITLAAGLLWGRTSRSAVADLVVELERTPPGAVRDALARTLGDPSLELALWLPDRGAYVDAEGHPVELSAEKGSRAVTVLGPPEAPIAALVHDPALLERRALLDSAGAAARLALENERLQAELRAQLAELRASRARIVTAGDEERRRLERNLHDGAQQRLLALGLALQLARGQVGGGANGAADLLAEAEDELRTALGELRELARGIHPAVLSDQGLDAALRSLAERSPVPVKIDGSPGERLGAPVEAAVYFLVSESLANVTKYARASSVRVRVTRRDGMLVVDVEDDGVGGADPSRGSGLRGLFDRINALDGRLDIESPRGHGTHLRAAIPCA